MRTQLMEDLEQLKVLENGYRMKARGRGGGGGGGRVWGAVAAGAAAVPAPAHAHLPPPNSTTQVVVVDHSAHGVDMPEDVASVEALMQAQGLE